jgi:hypothetical protein
MISVEGAVVAGSISSFANVLGRVLPHRCAWSAVRCTAVPGAFLGSDAVLGRYQPSVSAGSIEWLFLLPRENQMFTFHTLEAFTL